MKLSQKQIDALNKILYTGDSYTIDRRTLNSLKKRNLINSMCNLTDEGIDVICPNAPRYVPTPEVEETRKVQDKLIDIILKKGFSMYMRISNDLPEEITGVRMATVVFPAYLSDLKHLANAWEDKWGAA